jgi:hypothetical protein
MKTFKNIILPIALAITIILPLGNISEAAPKSPPGAPPRQGQQHRPEHHNNNHHKSHPNGHPSDRHYHNHGNHRHHPPAYQHGPVPPPHFRHYYHHHHTFEYTTWYDGDGYRHMDRIWCRHTNHMYVENLY